MSEYHLAQLNIAYAKAPIDSDIMIDFVTQLDAVNEAAESAPGFVWRLKDDESNNATGFNAFDDENMLINISVWTTVEALKKYLYEGLHLQVFKDKHRWFEKMDSHNLVLWWIKADSLPTIDAALERLSYLNTNGPSEHAFTLGRSFPAPNKG